MSSEQLSNNPLVRAKQIAVRFVQELITKDETKARRLAEIKAELEALHNAKEMAVAKVEERAGELLEEAAEIFEHDNARFMAWWSDVKWTDNSDRPPFSAMQALRIKNLYEFCTRTPCLAHLSQPKVPNGFERTALYELTASKYIKDERNEAGHSSENIRRKEVRDATYDVLKNRARVRAQAAEKAGTQPRLITKQEVIEELTKQFRAAGMVPVHKTVNRKSLKWFLEDVEKHCIGAYSSWEGDADAQAAIIDKIEEVLQTIKEW